MLIENIQELCLLPSVDQFSLTLFSLRLRARSPSSTDHFSGELRARIRKKKKKGKKVHHDAGIKYTNRLKSVNRTTSLP